MGHGRRGWAVAILLPVVFIATLAAAAMVVPQPASPWQGANGGGLGPGLQFAPGTGVTAGGLSYQHGLVLTGDPKVYLVFWGSQWGQPTKAGRWTTLANDPSNVAPTLQKLFAGLGTNGEKWSNILAQYCQPTDGSSTCHTASSVQVKYPTGGALGGVWVDESAPAPGAADQGQFYDEISNAAKHFHDYSSGGPGDPIYAVVTPTGTTPLQFMTSDCASHGYSGTHPALYLPYVPDGGASCGANMVNHGNAGLDDGVTLTAAHEYAEALTDPNPAQPGGWTEGSEEIGDKCDAGATGIQDFGNVHMATGTFAMPPLWSNDAQSCLLAAPSPSP